MKVPKPVRREIQRAIDMIHRDDNYDEGMDLLHRLAHGHRLKKRKNKTPRLTQAGARRVEHLH